MYSELIPVAYEYFEGKAFAKNESFVFAKNEAFCEIVYTEIGDAISTFPLAMTRVNGIPKLIALFSVIPGQNCFVTPDGRWIGSYIPHAIKNYPFMIYPHPEKPTERLLCIEKSSVVSSSHKSAQELFTKEGKHNHFLESFIRVLENFQQTQMVTDVAIKQLVDADLFVEWELLVQSEDNQKQRVGGIYRIDEDRLRHLPLDTLGALSRSGALGVAYAQILSRNRIDLLKVIVSERMKYIADKEKLSLKISDQKEGGDHLDWGF